MIEEVFFGSGSPFVIFAIFVWTLVVANASYSVVKHAVVELSLKDPFKFSFKRMGVVILDVLVLGAVLLSSRAAEDSVLEFLYLVANPDVESVGIWGEPPWWVAVIVGLLVGSAVAAIQGRQHHEAA